MKTNEERHARVMAKRIESYWAGMGYPSVACRVEKIVAGVGEIGFEVKCNLENGLPPDFRREDMRRLENRG